MDYETPGLQQEPADRPAEETPIPPQSEKTRRRRWPIVVGIILLLLVIAVVVCLLSGTFVRIERTDHSLSLVVGMGAPKPQLTEQTASTDPAAYIGSGQQLDLAPSAQGAPNTPSSAPGALSLQEIFAQSQPCLASVAAARQRGTLFGTAVILSEDGYLLTNAKAIERAASLFVTLESGEMMEAVLVGSDASSDVAVLKVDAEGLTPAVFGDSSSLRVGDLAVSICGPLSSDSSFSMTEGIISGINPAVTRNGRQISILRTSAVGGGKTGCPLFNCYGQVIGLCTTRVERSFSASNNESTCTAIPTSAIKLVVDELIEKGYVSGRPSIGVSVEDLPDRARIYYGLPSGVYVTAVQAGSGAEQAGVQTGDIITALNDRPITGAASLEQIRNNYAAGDVIELTIYREGQYLRIPVPLMQQDPNA